MSKVPLTSINPLRVLQPHDRTSIDELYGAPGPERFNWIWMKGTHQRRALWGLTREELNNEIENVQEPEGFHVAHVGGMCCPASPCLPRSSSRVASQTATTRPIAPARTSTQSTPTTRARVIG